MALLETIILHDTAWLHLPPGKDPLDRARGSRDLAAAVARVQRQTGARFVVTNRYMTTALMSFYLPGQPAVYVQTSPHVLNEIQVWPGYQQTHADDDGLWVSDARSVADVLPPEFARFDLFETHDVVQDGRFLKRFYIYWCRRKFDGGNQNNGPEGPSPSVP